MKLLSVNYFTHCVFLFDDIRVITMNSAEIVIVTLTSHHIRFNDWCSFRIQFMNFPNVLKQISFSGAFMRTITTMKGLFSSMSQNMSDHMIMSCFNAWTKRTTISLRHASQRRNKNRLSRIYSEPLVLLEDTNENFLFRNKAKIFAWKRKSRRFSSCNLQMQALLFHNWMIIVSHHVWIYMLLTYVGIQSTFLITTVRTHWTSMRLFSSVDSNMVFHRIWVP